MENAEFAICVNTATRINAGKPSVWYDLESVTDWDDMNEEVRESLGLEEHDGDVAVRIMTAHGVPDSFIKNNGDTPIIDHIDSDLWDNYINLDDDDRELIDVYQCAIDENGYIDEARDSYHGKFNWPADFAREITLETSNIPEHLENYIDYEKMARDMSYDGWTFHEYNGYTWVFSPG